MLKPQPGGDAGALVAERADRLYRHLGTGLTVYFAPAGESAKVPAEKRSIEVQTSAKTLTEGELKLHRS